MTTVNVSGVTNTVSVTGDNNGTPVVTVETQGPQGPQGPAGVGFLFTQASPSTTWLINHNLGFKPVVQMFDAGSQEIEGLISHPSLNTTSILFAVPIAGFARLV
jgi:hypothetical protein